MVMWIVAGAPGMGKSPFVQSYIKERNCLIFDVQNEYGFRTKYPGQTPIGLSTNTNEARSRYIGGDVKKFISLCVKKTNTVCVFEEATGFFRGSVGMETMQLVINRKFTGNVYMFIFHSIARIPPALFEMSEWMCMLKTNDEADGMKFKKLIPYYNDLRSQPNGAKHLIPLLEI